MRHALTAWLTASSFMLLDMPAAGQTTKPSPDLAKENAQLRAYAEKLEARIAELEMKLKEEQKKASTRMAIRPAIPAPYGYQLPAQPFKLPTPTPAPIQPYDDLSVPPPLRVPDTWKRHEFNGQAFYLIPLR